jgi:hypothetical protein
MSKKINWEAIYFPNKKPKTLILKNISEIDSLRETT